MDEKIPEGEAPSRCAFVGSVFAGSESMERGGGSPGLFLVHTLNLVRFRGAALLLFTVFGMERGRKKERMEKRKVRKGRK